MNAFAGVIQYSEYWFEDLPFQLAMSKQGLCYIGLPNTDQTTMLEFLNRHYLGAQIKQSHDGSSEVRSQLDEYFSGTRTNFDIPTDFQGTPFQIAVWRTLATIPYGQLWSYGDVARAIGNEKAARAVGTANGQNPIPIVVPCHRVIGSNGMLTGYRGGLRLKERLLQLEGVKTYKSKGHARFAF